MIIIDDRKHIDQSLQSDWDTFVNENPTSTFYHLYGWKSVLSDIFNFKPFYLLHRDDHGKIDGILPTFLMKDILRRKYLISNPFSNFTGSCSNDKEIALKLNDEAKSLGKKLGVRYVELRGLNSIVDDSLPKKNSFYTLYLDIKGKTRQNQWDFLKSRNRGKIRKAEKFGLSFFNDLNYLPEFYKVYSKNISDLGTPIFPIKYFQKVVQVFNNQVDLIGLKYEGKVVSGMFLFKFKNLLSEPWVSSLSEYNRVYINNLLYWKAIEYAISNGFEIFDFGRSTIDTGTYSFKMQWGAQPIPLYYQYILNKSKDIPKVDAKDNKYQMVINIWKKLPLPVASFCGPKIVRYLPEL